MAALALPRQLSTTQHWPCYFVARAPSRPGRRTAMLRAGDPFPFQDKQTIRGLAAAWGVDGLTTPFAQLDYVTTVNVYTEELRQDILRRNLSLSVVQDMLHAAGAPDPLPVATPAPRAERRRGAER